ncbi:MAG: hypothetical protein ABL951_01180 [Alphaproteobacteria bacterium]
MPGTGISLLRYMLITALGDRLFLALPVMMGLGAALIIFLSSSAIIEQREMAAAFFGAGSRLLVIIGLVLFVCFHIRQAMAGGEIALILSRPISRGAFVLIYSASLVMVGLICVAIGAALLWVCARPPLDGLLIWGVSLALETSLMILTAVFFGLILDSAVASALACLGFYVLGRMSGLLGMLASHASDGSLVEQILGNAFALISILIPRLDFFSRSEWLVYGWSAPEPGIAWAILQALVFIPLILAAATLDFSRKRL